MNSDRRNTGLAARIGIVGAMVLALMGLVAPLTASANVVARSNGNGGGDDNFQHIFVIMMENTSFSSLIGNANAPWINFAATKFGFATNYTGVSHPSQPNYIAATSGSTNGVVDDNDVTINVKNIVDQLEGKHRTWKAYMQSLSLCNGDLLAHACGDQLYERKHNPFVSYTDVQTNAARLANIVDFSQFSTDLANNQVPNFSWISPDQCNDMHGRAATPADPCDFSNVQPLITAGDTFLHNTVGAIMNSKTWQHSHSLILITWDESDFPFSDVSGCCDAVPGGGHVVTLAISSENNKAHTSRVAYNHYSMLLTVEDAWKLGCLAFTCDRANVKPMRDLVRQQD